MTHTNKKLPPRLTLRLSPAQHQLLESRAGAKPLSAFVRERLFAANDNAPITAPAARGKLPFRDRKAMAQALALLGRSELSSSLREIARLAHLGALPMTPDTEVIIQQACREVSEIKSLLMKGLGVKED